MPRRTVLAAPFLKRLTLLAERVEAAAFPFDTLRFLKNGRFELGFETPITFFVGENGSGKSTLLEAIARLCGFSAEGGSSDHRTGGRGYDEGVARLADALRPSWLPRVTQGFFFRSESFFNVAGYLDEVADRDRLGGRAMHAQSHGEAFLALFSHRLTGDRRALYLMDEPETALSPSRQLAFLAVMRDWERSGNVQAIIATHSPILLCYPGARLVSFDGDGLAETTAEQTEHVRVTRAFLANPARCLKELFDDDG
jgi:predicted ATPase